MGRTRTHRIRTVRAIAAAAAVLVGLGAIAPPPANAQRRLRLTLGVSSPRTESGHTGSGLFFVSGPALYTATRSSLIGGISYDIRLADDKNRDGRRRRLVTLLYSDSGTQIDLFSPTASYTGYGVALRREERSRYYGAGIGLYRLSRSEPVSDGPPERTTPGGKLFLGAQGRGSLFLELNLTLVGRVGEHDLSGPSLILGARL